MRKPMLVLLLIKTNLQYVRGNDGVIQFITASSSSHFKSSLQLLASIFSHEANAIVTYVDLGLRQSEVFHIKREFPNVEIVSFPFDSYPVWFNMAEDAGKFAWKPTSIDLFYRKNAQIIVWVDAGCKLTGKLRLAGRIAVKNGFFILPANGSVASLTHPESIRSLDFEDLSSLPMLSAAFIAFDLSNKGANEILETWKINSQIKEVISPRDSNWLNHRYDQSLLSIIIHKIEVQGRFNYQGLPSRFFNFLIHQDVD